MTANSKVLTLNTWLAQASGRLSRTDINSARLDGELLAGFVLNKSRTWVHGHGEYKISGNQHAQLDGLLKRRLNHEPIAYILGLREFYGRSFTVSSDVLVPRPESEDFIELIKSISDKDLKFIDIGTGSGVLAITIALEQPSWSGTATDISPKALIVAQKNAQNLKAKNLVFKVQNLLAEDSNIYDLIIANLPYVPENLRGKPDIAHEPEIALFADNDGLGLYQQLFAQVATRGQKPTHILTESLQNQHPAIKKLALAIGYNLKETRGLIQHFILRV